MRILLGAQRFDPSAAAAAAEAGLEGPFATITAGWQEREDEDGELDAHLGGGTVNLRVYRRVGEAARRDPELLAAHRARQRELKHRQDFYRVRLEHELAAAHVVATRAAPPALLADEDETSVTALRVLDRWHLAKCDEVAARFEAEWRPLERESVQLARAEIARDLTGCGAVVITGGHVGALLTRLRLLGLADLLAPLPLLAWSAGAMALTERVVLYHDRPPQGPGASEVLARGLGLVPGVVALPEPERRLRLDDPERLSLLARRFAPALCLGLPARACVAVRGGRPEAAHGVIAVRTDGGTRAFEPGPGS